MNDWEEIGHELETSVTLALQRLRDRFPVEARIKDAAPAQREVYIRILCHWIREAAPPDAEIASPPQIAELAAIDAIVNNDHGIGCYPFSACKTDISVKYAGKCVHAMCAIDAFAIPRMVNQVSQISTKCAGCHYHLACTVTANGSVELDDRHPDAALVVWEPDSGEGAQACCNTLCPGIRFFCKLCLPPASAFVFSLPQASSIGTAFFEFQMDLLVLYSK